MARVPKTPESAPEQTETVGPAERQRLEMKAKMAEALRQAEQDLADAEAALEESKRAYAHTSSPENFANLLRAPKAAVEQCSLKVEHRKAALALYDSEELLQLVERWDSAYPDGTSASSQFRADIEPETEIVREAALALVSAMVAMREKFDRSRNAAAKHAQLAKELKDYGIRVHLVTASEHTIQSTVARALRVALDKFELSPWTHFVQECLSPQHYDPPAPPSKVRSSRPGEEVTYRQADRHFESTLRPLRNPEAEAAR